MCLPKIALRFSRSWVFVSPSFIINIGKSSSSSSSSVVIENILLAFGNVPMNFGFSNVRENCSISVFVCWSRFLLIFRVGDFLNIFLIWSVNEILFVIVSNP